jgi:hypothetical protein
MSANVGGALLPVMPAEQSNGADTGPPPERGSDERRRDRYWMWDSRSEDIDGLSHAANALEADGVMRRMPDKNRIRRDGPEALLEGWLPREPIIAPETRVIAMGSCFAALFVEWLAANGYNRAFDAMSDRSLVMNPLETPLAVSQQFRWAFREFDPTFAFWFTRDKKKIEATEGRRLELRRTIASAEVMVITLGLAEAWFDRESGEATWRLPPPEYRTERFEFAVTTAAETARALETIDRLRCAYAPRMKIVYTLSPIRFAATFRPMSPLVANIISKSILRAGLDEFFRAHPTETNETYFYFPSYEIVTELFDDPYENNRHIHPHHADVVIDLFSRYYTTFTTRASARFPTSIEDELRETIARLQEKIALLQGHCDARQDTIDALKATCDERLGLIERLDSELSRVRQAGHI